MNALIDFNGHIDLFYSLYTLFEKRLGYTVYIPMGNEWIDQGLQDRFYNIPREHLCNVTKIDNQETHFHMQMEPDQGKYDIRAITLDRFKAMNFDLVVCSAFFNEYPCAKLVQTYKPNAKFIRQIANIREKALGYSKNILLGAAYHKQDYDNKIPQEQFIHNNVNYFIYYPEQYEGYQYTDPISSKKILCLSRGLAQQDLDVWNQFKHSLEPQGFSFHMFGNQNFPYDLHPQYGSSVPHIQLPQVIKSADFIWYTKPAGGGGYTVRQALASGRPVIIRRSYSSLYTEIECNLFHHGLNCIDLDQVKPDQAIEMFLKWSEPNMHQTVCKQTAETFIRDTDFDNTTTRIATWLNKIERGAR